MPAKLSARAHLRRIVAVAAILAIVGAFVPGAVASPSTQFRAVLTDFVVHTELRPNDSYYGDQWGLPQIDAPQAWDVTLGSRSVIVAVVDTGVYWTHADLQGNMWANPMDGTHGYDFIDQDTNPMDVDPSGIYHGTGVAGVIAAITNNAAYVAGAAQVSVIALRALGLNGQGSSFNTSQAIRWAADHGAKVINLSLGTNETLIGPTDIQLAIDYAWSRGSLIVAAAGNSGVGTLDYPARLPNVVSVGAIARTGQKAGFSNFGPGLDLSAPGDEILTIDPNGIAGVHYLRGTSFAAPFVTAAAALLLSAAEVAGISLTNVDVWNILNSSAVQPSGSGYNQNYGWGVVNVWNAINALNQPFISVSGYPTSVSRSSTFSVTWSIIGPAGLAVTDTHVVWGTVPGRLGNATALQSGQTRQSYTASGLTMPSGANALYFKVVANVNGSLHESREYPVTASNLPDFLFVLYQLLASNLLFLALFILALAAIVAFIPQRRAARARRAAYRPKTMYAPSYYVPATRPPQPPPASAPASPRIDLQSSGPAGPPSAPPPAPPMSPGSPITAGPAKKRCPHCRTLVNADNLFCFFCGNPFR